MSQPIQLLLVEAGALFRHCLAAQLNRRRGIHVVGHTGHGGEALRLARSLRPEVVVIDPDVPEGGPGLIADLCRELPQCAVLVLMAEARNGKVSELFQAGARGYVLKTSETYDLEDFVLSIQRLHAGELVMMPDVADGLLKASSTEDASHPAGALSPRELEVLRLVARGRTNPEIARELYITEYTAKGHLAKILRKLALGNRVQLATYALKHGLVVVAC